MKKNYYGLRIMSILYQALAVVIALFAIGATGSLWAENYLNPAEGAVETPAWAMQALMTLGTGGLVALTCYVLSQLIDAQLETLKNTQEIQESLSTLKHMQTIQLDIHQMLKRRTRMSEPVLNSPVKEEDLDKIQHQLEERSQKLRSELG